MGIKVAGKRNVRGWIGVLVAAFLLTGCSGAVNDSSQPESASRVDTGFIVTGPDSYDSADTAVLADIREKENTLTFYNLEVFLMCSSIADISSSV